MSDLQQELCDYCVKLGADRLWVQGAGGNISFKQNDILTVKASGTWLAHANQKNIFTNINYHHLREALDNKDFTVTPQMLETGQLKPSIETLMHGLMRHKIVLHLHAIESLAWLVRPQPQDIFTTKLAKICRFAMVPYAKPGAKLAEQIADALANNPDANVVFLQNHGIVIGGESIKEIDDLLQRIHTVLSNEARSIKIPDAIPPSPHHAYQPIMPHSLHGLVYDDLLWHLINTAWALYPDHVVFLGAVPKIYQENQKIDNDDAELIFIKNHGIFSNKKFTAIKQAQLQCYYDVLIRQNADTPLQTLTDAQIAELLNWDAEHYRMQLAENR
ncbi:MAG: class II aldolase/adducin family protein [Alphaproteobacteria bacterium]|nr:class II aldolase/adducin family protein [Alphaproteobacteria bacterium]